MVSEPKGRVSQVTCQQWQCGLRVPAGGIAAVQSFHGEAVPQIVNPRRSPAMIQDAGATTDAIPVGDQGRGAERPARLVSPTIPEERRRGFHWQVSATTLGQ